MPQAYRDSPLAPLFPASVDAIATPDADQVLKAQFHPRLTPLGVTSPALQLMEKPADNLQLWNETLAPLRWMVRVSDLRPGVRVLAEHPDLRGIDNQPLPIITLQFHGHTQAVSSRGGVLRAEGGEQAASQAQPDLHELVLKGDFSRILFRAWIELVEEAGHCIQTCVGVPRRGTRAGNGGTGWKRLFHVAGRLGGSRANRFTAAVKAVGQVNQNMSERRKRRTQPDREQT